jgi:type 1 glutamine amidotransferase
MALIGALFLLGAGSACAAPPGMDCPLATTPYSSATPLIDLLIDPRARAVLDRELGPVLDRMPPRFATTTPPSFATIIAVRELIGMIGRKDGDAVAAKLDAELRAIPLTDAAIRARCARYDRTPPPIPPEIRHPALLVFDKITGFRDGPSVDATADAIKAIARQRGWMLYFSANGAVFNRRDLARFDAVIWNNVSGDALTVPQEQAFRHYLAQGGGFVGFHGAGGDPLYVWDWYADTLIGARFIGPPMAPQFQDARVVVDDDRSAITQGLGGGWTMKDEWYSFAASPRKTGAHILLTLDESSYNPIGYGGQRLAMGDHPIAWTRCIGDGRSFYSAIGHRPESYTEPHNRQLMEQGIAWAAGLGKTRCRAGQETVR